MADENTQAIPSIAEGNKGVISVNSRGPKNAPMLAKLLGASVIVGFLIVASLMGFNKWRTDKKERDAMQAQQSKIDNREQAKAPTKTFAPVAPPVEAPATAPAGDPKGLNECQDGSAGTVLLGADGKPQLNADGSPRRICPGQTPVPQVAGQASGEPLHVQSTSVAQNGQQTASRYGGALILPVSTSSTGAGQGAMAPTGPSTTSTIQMVRELMAGTGGGPGMGTAPAAAGGSVVAPAQVSPAGSVGSMLSPSVTPTAFAGKVADLNMLLPKGRLIPCALTTRIVSDIAGMATCVITEDVYGANGNVRLIEKGSEVNGEYASTMTQGVRRLFFLWTSLLTQKGVSVQFNSPAADGLGTAGLDGVVDNHWWERIGAAFLLSTVQDAIAYETARATSGNGNGSGAQGVAVFQQTSQTGNAMAQKVLESTINIKPTLYKTQGDIASIYVARDIDFGSVYALRNR